MKPQRQGVSEEAATRTLRILAVVLLLFGALQAYGSYRDVRRGQATETWPQTNGRVTRSVKRGRVSPTFQYDYEVRGARFTASHVGFVVRPFFRPTRHYRNGDSLSVRYDPGDPTVAVIRWGVPLVGLLGELVAPLILFATGGYLLRLSVRT
ncbi:MAG: DUF3592 domain-containing protein [Gemmatimonadaceae bacterium]